MTNEGWLKRNMVAIVGFAIQLLALGLSIARLGAYLGRQDEIIANQEKRIAILEQRVQQHHEDTAVHTTREWRDNVMAMLNRLDGKMDAHIMRSGR